MASTLQVFPIGTFYKKSLPGILVLLEIIPLSKPPMTTMTTINTSPLRIVEPTWL